MGLVAQYADIPELVSAMTALAIEGLTHFREVLRHLQRRGISLGSDPGDPYARALLAEVEDPRGQAGRPALGGRAHRARSCRRLASSPAPMRTRRLCAMWKEMARAEAAHGPLFLELARRLGPSPEAVDARLEELEHIERRLIDEGPSDPLSTEARLGGVGRNDPPRADSMRSAVPSIGSQGGVGLAIADVACTAPSAIRAFLVEA